MNDYIYLFIYIRHLKENITFKDMLDKYKYTEEQYFFINGFKGIYTKDLRAFLRKYIK